MLAGLLAGPVLGLVNFSSLLKQENFSQLISLGVALILFEGGLSLKFKQVKQLGNSIFSLIIVGNIVTFSLTCLAARYVLAQPWSVAVLSGCILLITGPTVIGPLLRNLKIHGPVARIAQWEGIINDPLGAILAALAFEFMVFEQDAGGNMAALQVLLLALLLSAALAFFLVKTISFLWRRFLLPDNLRVVTVFTAVVTGFALSESFQKESGLVTVTLMGILFANDKNLHIGEIVDFKENLSTIIISSLFIVIAADLQLTIFTGILWPVIIFFLLLVLVIRPLAVFIAQWRDKAELKHKVMLSLLAPRGIVVIALASLLGSRLSAESPELAQGFRDVIILMVFATVVFYSIAAGVFARLTGISKYQADGVLILGINRLSLSLASALKENDVEYCLVEADRESEKNARMQGFLTHYAHNWHIRLNELSLSDLNTLVVMSSNAALAAVLASKLGRHFNRQSIFSLAGSTAVEARSLLPALEKAEIEKLIKENYEVHHLQITEKFSRPRALKKIADKRMIVGFKAPARGFSVQPLDDESPLVPGCLVFYLAQRRVNPNID